jgi:hypothetical protein
MHWFSDTALQCSGSAIVNVTHLGTACCMHNYNNALGLCWCIALPCLSCQGRLRVLSDSDSLTEGHDFMQVISHIDRQRKKNVESHAKYPQLIWHLSASFFYAHSIVMCRRHHANEVWIHVGLVLLCYSRHAVPAMYPGVSPQFNKWLRILSKLI